MLGLSKEQLLPRSRRPKACSVGKVKHKERKWSHYGQKCDRSFGPTLEVRKRRSTLTALKKVANLRHVPLARQDKGSLNVATANENAIGVSDSYRRGRGGDGLLPLSKELYAQDVSHR